MADKNIVEEINEALVEKVTTIRAARPANVPLEYEEMERHAQDFRDSKFAGHKCKEVEISKAVKGRLDISIADVLPNGGLIVANVDLIPQK